MPYLTRIAFATPPRNLCDLLLRDLSSLLLTSHQISRSARSLRPQCAFSRELTTTLDTIATTSDAGERLLHTPLAESGVVLPEATDARESALLTDFFLRLPKRVAPGVLAAEVASNLRLLAQHLELKASLAAEEALFIGQEALGQALMNWAAEWRACGGALRFASGRARAQAYAADLAPEGTP